MGKSSTDWRSLAGKIVQFNGHGFGAISISSDEVAPRADVHNYFILFVGYFVAKVIGIWMHFMSSKRSLHFCRQKPLVVAGFGAAKINKKNSGGRSQIFSANR